MNYKEADEKARKIYNKIPNVESKEGFEQMIKELENIFPSAKSAVQWLNKETKKKFRVITKTELTKQEIEDRDLDFSQIEENQEKITTSVGEDFDQATKEIQKELYEKIIEEVWVKLRLYEEFHYEDTQPMLVETLTNIVDSMGIDKSNIYQDAQGQARHLLIQSVALDKLAGYILADEDKVKKHREKKELVKND